MGRAIDRKTLIELIIEAKRTDPETGSFTEWLEGYLLEHLLPLPYPSNEWVVWRTPFRNREQVEKMRSRWITVVEVNGEQYSKCAACQNGLDGLEDAYSFCPHCGAPMTDEAVEMVMERLEALV